MTNDVCLCVSQADKLYEDKKKKEAEAMKYWDEQKKLEQVHMRQIRNFILEMIRY